MHDGVARTTLATDDAYPRRVQGALSDRRQITGAIRITGWRPLALAAAVLGLEWLGTPTARIDGVPLVAVLVAGLGLATIGWAAADAVAIADGDARAVAWLAIPAAVVAGVVVVHVVDPHVLDLFVRERLDIKPDTRSHEVLGGLAVVVGVYARGVFGRAARSTQAVAVLAMLTSLIAMNIAFTSQPFRDIGLYLDAGSAFHNGGVVYDRLPMTVIPTDLTELPFVYPPFTLPLFGALSTLPAWLAIGGWEVACLASVVAGLRLIGVRWALLPAFLLWPPIAVGLQVGNVACFAFLVLGLAWRVPAAAPIAGVFKPQSALMALWLLRERRWRALVLGIAVVAALVLVTLPITGLAIYADWLQGLQAFQASTEVYPGLKGWALGRDLPMAIATVLALAAIGFALLARGREGLARSAVAAVVASPTVYVHGLALLLPATLLLDAAATWALIAVAAWGPSVWLAVAGMLVLLARGATRVPSAAPAASDESPEPLADAGVHPLGGNRLPWPDGEPRRADEAAPAQVVAGGPARTPKNSVS